MPVSGVRRRIAALALLCLIAVGCGRAPYQVAEVEGVLLIKGKPGAKVSIQFVPDPGKGTKGQTSTAETDADGRFTLELKERGRFPRQIRRRGRLAPCGARRPEAA